MHRYIKIISIYILFAGAHVYADTPAAVASSNNSINCPCAFKIESAQPAFSDLLHGISISCSFASGRYYQNGKPTSSPYLAFRFRTDHAKPTISWKVAPQKSDSGIFSGYMCTTNDVDPTISKSINEKQYDQCMLDVRKVIHYIGPLCN